MSTVPLKRLAEVVAGQSPPSVNVEDFTGDGLPFLQGNAEFGHRSPTPRNRCDGAGKRARPGDLLVSVRAPVGALNWSEREYGIGRGLAAVRPGPSLDPAFCWWWLHAAVPDLRAGATGSTYDAVTAEEIGALRVPGWTVADQRAIADFLDTKTARIDALIAKKRRMIDLLRERHKAFVDYQTRSDRYVPLRRVTDLLPGFMFASDDFDPEFEGDRLLRGVNIGVGALRWDDEVRLRPGAYAPERYRLREHDVVVGMDRPFISGGTRVAMIDEESAGALLVQRVCRIRASSQAFATVVSNLLGSRRFVAHVEPDLTGVSVPHLSDSQIGSFPIPLLPAPDLEAIANRLSQAFALLNATRACLDAQVALLREHRQALITAAVTGELEVPEVAA